MRSLKYAIALLAAAAVALPAQTAKPPQWKIQFFHDEDRSQFVLTDFQFASARRGLACGIRIDKGERKPVLLLTSDGGEKWEFATAPDFPISMFFLDETAGWMVTTGGIYFTNEAGRSWKRVSRERGVTKIWFLDANRGFGVGPARRAVSTVDGGKTWKPIPEAEALKQDRNFTRFTELVFVNPKVGLISGRHRTPRRRDPSMPVWMDPEPDKRIAFPSTLVFLQTSNGGQTWTSSTSSIFGTVTRYRMNQEGRRLVLVEFDEVFDYPSEVLMVDSDGVKTKPVFRQKNRAVSDVTWLPGGVALLGAVEPQGTIRMPAPGKIRVIRSADQQKWDEMPVDYRAFGNRVIFASLTPDDIWMATDAGMILRWTGK